MTRQAHDWMMGGRVPAAQFESIGAVASGEVLSYERAQQRALDGTLRVYSDGQPMWQMVFTIQTGLRDEAIPNDDGVRKVYARGGKIEPGAAGRPMLDAIREAVRESGWGAKNLVGGILSVRFECEGTPVQRGWKPPKQYRAKFVPPAVEVPFEAAQPAAAPAQHEEPPDDFGAPPGDEEPF